MMSDDIGVSDAQAAEWEAAKAFENTSDAADDLRTAWAERGRRVLALEGERDELQRKVTHLEARLATVTDHADRSCALLMQAAAALLSADRRTKQLDALLRQWAEREHTFKRTTVDQIGAMGLSNWPWTVPEAAAGIMHMCRSELAALLKCKNPDCPSCAADKAKSEQPVAGENGDATARP